MDLQALWLNLEKMYRELRKTKTIFLKNFLGAALQ